MESRLVSRRSIHPLFSKHRRTQLGGWRPNLPPTITKTVIDTEGFLDEVNTLDPKARSNALIAQYWDVVAALQDPSLNEDTKIELINFKNELLRYMTSADRREIRIEQSSWEKVQKID